MIGLMNIKKAIKRCPGIKLMVRIRDNSRRTLPLKYETKLWKQYFVHGTKVTSLNCLERDILVYSHVIEKGLCHKDFRPRFGERFVRCLVHDIRKLEKVNNRSFALKVGKSSLEAYRKRNEAAGVNVDDLLDKYTSSYLLDADAGSYEISVMDFFGRQYASFNEFARSRHSMRCFEGSQDPVSQKILVSAIELAQTAPSACNRQPIRVFVVSDNLVKRRIIDLQGGAKGFGENAPVLLVVTNNLGFYNSSERRLPYVDGGIFVMNMLYALHYYKLGACVLNGSFEETAEKEIRKLINMQAEEVVIACIAVSNPKSSSTLLVAKTPRKTVDEIVVYI